MSVSQPSLENAPLSSFASDSRNVIPTTPSSSPPDDMPYSYPALSSNHDDNFTISGELSNLPSTKLFTSMIHSKEFDSPDNHVIPPVPKPIIDLGI